VKRFIVLLVMVVFISISFINCSEDEVTTPENKSPAAVITGPADGASFIDGEIISFTGTGTDPEEGTLPEDSLLWTSDKDGQIGTGTSVSAFLSINDHIITLTVTDSNSNTDTDNITIHVTDHLITVPATSGYYMGYLGIAFPVREVSLDEFQIGKYEVTYALWTEVKTWAESNGYTFASAGAQGSGGSKTDQHPVTMINWRDCIAWCNAYSEKEGLAPVYYTASAQTGVYRNSSTGGDISNDCVNWDADGFRLPTEAEWEYAARYIDGTSVSPGDQHSGYNLQTEIDSCAWYSDNAGFSTHPVGQLQANSLGARDMSGNVWEWCWDWYDTYPNIPQENPLGPPSGTYRVIRGNSWGGNAAGCRTAIRNESDHTGVYPDVGFRVCRGGSAL